MARVDTLRVCRSHLGKRHLLKEEFYQLNKTDRAEAILWLLWPATVKAKVVQKIARIESNSGTIFTVLKQTNRAVHCAEHTWRFKPQ